jgi:hypothetical protein
VTTVSEPSLACTSQVPLYPVSKQTSERHGAGAARNETTEEHSHWLVRFNVFQFLAQHHDHTVECLDIPLYLVIVALGTTKPMTWTLFFTSSAVAVAVAVALTLVVPRLFRWSP